MPVRVRKRQSEQILARLDRALVDNHGRMKDFISQIRADPSCGNCAIVGMLLAGAAGAIVGLLVGLLVYAATAWAAMFELGLPAAVVGAAAGFLVGCARALAGWSRRRGSG